MRWVILVDKLHRVVCTLLVLLNCQRGIPRFSQISIATPSHPSPTDHTPNPHEPQAHRRAAGFCIRYICISPRHLAHISLISRRDPDIGPFRCAPWHHGPRHWSTYGWSLTSRPQTSVHLWVVPDILVPDIGRFRGSLISVAGRPQVL